MANKAGIYKCLWRPKEIDCKYAKDILKILWDGYDLLNSKPKYFKKFNPKNGWGDYDTFVKQVRRIPLNPKIKNLVNKYSGNPIAALRTIVNNRLLNKTEPSSWEEYSRFMIYCITFKKSYLNKMIAVVAVEK